MHLKIKHYILLSIIITFISCSSEESYKEVISTWNNGNSKTEIYWFSKKDSTFIELNYFKNGKINQEKILSNGELEKLTAYYATGEIAAIFMYENGNQIAGSEYYKNGQKRGEIPFDLHGNLNGNVRYYNENGQITTEGKYLNDKRHGIWKYYDENGDLEKIEEFERGKKIQI